MQPLPARTCRIPVTAVFAYGKGTKMCGSRPLQQQARKQRAARACTTRSLSLPDCFVQRFFAAMISSKPADSDTPSSLYASCRDMDAGKEASGSDDDLAIVQLRRRTRV